MAQFERGHALIVGAGGDLSGTVDDARGLAQILQDSERCAYPPEQVRLLTGPKATRPNVLAGLDLLAAETSAEDTAIVYFSGHGYRVVSTFGHAYYLMPHGYDIERLYATAISGSEFVTKLAAIPARRMLVLLDCCHAGGIGAAKASQGLEMTKAPLPEAAVALLSEGAGRVLIASSKENEESFAGKPYSAFTLALIEALVGRGVAVEDGYVRVTDLALHARQVVPKRTNDRQHPILHFEHADNFVLAYYAGGDDRPKGLPFSHEPEIEPEPGTWRGAAASGDRNVVGGGNVEHNTINMGDRIDTGGGTFIGGNASAGGDIITEQ